MSVSSVLCVMSHCCQIPYWKINVMWFKSELHITTFSMASAEGPSGSEQNKVFPTPQKKQNVPNPKLCLLSLVKSLHMCALLDGAPTSVCHFFCLSVCPSICCAPYLKNCTSSDYNFWYKCAKWYLQVLFSFFQNFDFLGV